MGCVGARDRFERAEGWAGLVWEGPGTSPNRHNPTDHFRVPVSTKYSVQSPLTSESTLLDWTNPTSSRELSVMMDSFGTEWAEEVKPHRPTEPCDQPPSLGSPQADSNPTVQPGSTPLPGRVKLDELSSAGSSLGPRPGSVQRPETDLDESEDDVPLARHYLRTQQLPAFPAQKHDGSASPSGSRKRGRPSQERTGPDWAGAADFLQVDQPRYTIIKASGTKDDPHVIRLKARVTDGILSRLPAVGSAHTNQGILHAAPDGLFQAWCLSIGGRVARLLGLRELVTWPVSGNPLH